MIKPDFFIVGAPKCGTTAMNDYLAQHPAIFMAKKELHFFGSDLKTKIKLSESEYLEYFRGAENKRVVGEASVWYLFSKNAAQEIKSFSPEARILIMLRNPVEVIYSLHSQHLYDGNEVERDFETALSLDEDRKKGKYLPDSVDYFELPPYRDSVLFSAQVKRYVDVFGKENVYIILYDDFVADTKGVVSGVLTFLKLGRDMPVSYDVINPNKNIRLFFLHRLIKKPPEWLKKTVRFILPVKRIRHAIMSYLFRQNVVFKKRSKMKDGLRQQLKEGFTADIKELERIIGRDLSAWYK